MMIRNKDKWEFVTKAGDTLTEDCIDNNDSWCSTCHFFNVNC
jgi:hypothetical protein